MTDNREQAEYWTDDAGPVWVAHQDRLDALVRPLGGLAMDALAPQQGERLLDVGCGCGDTTLQLARHVGGSGRVVGIDLSRPMLERAGQRVAEAGAGNVELRLADAQVEPLDPAFFDGAFSRFGVMFFSDPVAAFSNLAGSLRPGGRLVFVCWQAVDRNGWIYEPNLALLKMGIPFPPLPSGDEPGPFAFGDGDRVRALLEAAGFGEADVRPHETTLVMAEDPDAAADVVLQVTPVRRVLVDADAALREQARTAVLEVTTRHHRDGAVRMPAAVWIVRAVLPDP